MSFARLKYLVEASLNQKATKAELDELGYLSQLPENEETLRLLIKEALDLQKETTDLPEASALRIEKNILSEGTSGRSLHLKRYAVAAAFLLVAGAGVLLFFKNRPLPSNLSIAAESPATNHIKPGGNKATLTLDDGTVIVLDSAANGQLTQQGEIRVIKVADGQLSYAAAPDSSQKSTGYSTIATPRGGQYMVELADGTRAWLNAASSIRFPNSFNHAERSVEIKGEVYFEVARSSSTGKASLPFVVTCNDMKVNVLGTHFNIMAYTDENAVQTTLLEGKISVTKHEHSLLLHPGEQVNFLNSGRYSLQKLDDPDQVIAWKNGRFELNGDIKGIMRQIARWYDVDVRYEGNVSNKKFGGAVLRSENVSEVLKIFELTENIKFRIEDRTIIVSP